ncbi:MAG: RDD family protein [Mycobacteriaceae bacterium]|nr:RDD family protein [Mycobacteriaceae bacterium]
MARPTASWLSGPQGDQSGPKSGYPGERLGLPRSGPGSLVGFGRRIGALVVDWLIGYGLAGLGVVFGVYSPAVLATAVLAVWLVLGVVAVRLFGFTPGQFVFGLMVASVTGRRHVGLGRALARGLLIALVVPPLFTDSDGRGLQDLLTGTAVVRR